MQAMESSRKRKAAPNTPSSVAEGSASKKLKLLNSKHAPAPKTDVQEFGEKLLQQLHRSVDKTGRSIVTMFLTLPPRDELPDYYEFTKMPIALDTIEKKLQRNGYPTMTTLESDFKRMVQNAKDYNAPKSDIYEDAERIRKLVYNYMKQHNPQYTEDPNYTSFPTPIPGEEGANGLDGAEETREASEKPRRALTIKLSEAPSERKASVAPSATTGDAEADGDGGEDDEGEAAVDMDFTGKTFQEAQQAMISHLLRYTDDEGLEIYSPFGNLPTRKLEDYYKLIRHPVSLKSVAKRCRGQHGRAPPSGVTDFKTWDAFEEEVSFIWRNAQEYNEDGSDMFILADEFKTHFKALMAEAREKVEEPAGPRIKLGGPKPKVMLNLSQPRNSPTPGVTVDNEALLRQKQMVAAGVNGHHRPTPPINGLARSSSHIQTIEPRPTGSPGASLVKPEKRSTQSPALAPALQSQQSNGTMMPPPTLARHPSNSPFPVGGPVGGPLQPPYSSQPAVSSYTYTSPSSLPLPTTRPSSVEDALLPTVTLATHPNLPLPVPYKLAIPAHPTLSSHSTTITLPPSHYFLQISPTISRELSMGRQYKMFVSLNGVRLNQRDTQFHVETGRRTHVYEGSLMQGVNRIEVEVAAAGKEGKEGGVEVEKVTVYANMMR